MTTMAAPPRQPAPRPQSPPRPRVRRPGRALLVAATALAPLAWGTTYSVTTALLGALVLGEVFTLVQVAGFGLALAALVAGQFNPARSASHAKTGAR